MSFNIELTFNWRSRSKKTPNASFIVITFFVFDSPHISGVYFAYLLENSIEIWYGNLHWIVMMREKKNCWCGRCRFRQNEEHFSQDHRQFEERRAESDAIMSTIISVADNAKWWLLNCWNADKFHISIHLKWFSMWIVCTHRSILFLCMWFFFFGKCIFEMLLWSNQK